MAAPFGLANVAAGHDAPREGQAVGRGVKDRTIQWRCEHPCPVVIEDIAEGRIARCLRCGCSGPPREGSEAALLALRGRSQRPGLPEIR